VFPCFLFWNFLLILLTSVAMVVLSWFSFSVVVISLSNSKTFQSFHAEILYLSMLLPMVKVVLKLKMKMKTVLLFFCIWF
jgi:hypothetical protein